MSMTNLGNTLLALRHERGLKLKDLSEVTKLSVPYLSAIENDKRTPDLNVIGVICSALGIEPYELLFKAAIEEKIAPERRRLVRELLPVLMQMQELVKEIYYDDEDDKPGDDEGPNKPHAITKKSVFPKEKEVVIVQEDDVYQVEHEELEPEMA